MERGPAHFKLQNRNVAWLIGGEARVATASLDPPARNRRPQGRMRRLFQVLSNMDAQAWRTLAVSFLLFGGVGIVFLFGAQMLGFDSAATVQEWLEAASGPWSLPVAVAA